MTTEGKLLSENHKTLTDRTEAKSEVERMKEEILDLLVENPDEILVVTIKHERGSHPRACITNCKMFTEASSVEIWLSSILENILPRIVATNPAAHAAYLCDKMTDMLVAGEVEDMDEGLQDLLRGEDD